VEEADLGGGKLGDLLLNLLADPAERTRLAIAMQKLAPVDAAARVCDAVQGA